MRARNLNFRQTRSERSATRSYKTFGADRAKRRSPLANGSKTRVDFLKEKYQKLKGEK